MEVPGAKPNDPRALRRLVRDLVAFAALPAVWINYDAQRIAESVAEVLRNALGLELVIITLRYGVRTLEVLCTPPALGEYRPAIRAALSPLLRSASSNASLSIPSPTGSGQMRIVIQLIGYPAESGVVIAGSSRADFPSDEDRLLLNVGANQAAILLLHKRSEQTLRESEERFRSLSAASPVGIFTTDLEGHLTYTNPRCQALCGITFDQALGGGWVDLAHPEDRPWVFEKWLAHARAGNDFYGEFRVMHPQLGLRWVQTRIVPIFSDGGQVLSHLGTIEDISAHMDAEAELERRVNERTAEIREASEKLQAEMAEHARAIESMLESEERFRLLVEHVVDYAIFLLSPSGHIVSWNEGAKRLKQYQAEEIIGQHYSRFYTAEDAALGRPERLLAAATREGHIEDVGWRVRKDGSLFWADVVITALRDGQGRLRGFAKITRDVTERKLAEEYLQQSNERLRMLSTHLQTAREEERTTIARELHDELGQILTVARIDLSRLVKRMTSSSQPESLPASKVVLDLRAVIQSIDDSLQSVRRIMQQLRPQTLDELGLKATLEAQAQQFQERTSIDCRFETTADGITLNPERSIALFRIFQEALTNVARHSGASQVHVYLRVSGPDLLLEIQDNGRGISAGEKEKAGHFGLLGMKERAILLGGDVTISGAPGQGTSVMARVPIT